MTAASTNQVTSSLSGLKLSPAKAKTTKAEVADSWEDEADEGSDTNTGTSTPVRPSSSDLPGAPPPTPVSPPSSHGKATASSPYQPFDYDGSSEQASSRRAPVDATRGLERRPEKSTAVAARLIAAGIGQKAPRRTQEQRDYDRAMKTQERRKRDEAREAEEKKQRDKEQAQKDVWGD